MRFLRDPILLTRVFFVLICTLVGHWVGRGYVPSISLHTSVLAFVLAILGVLVEVSTGIVSSKKILLATAGLFFGLVMAALIYPTVPPWIFGDADNADGMLKARIICNLLFGYYGAILAIKHANRFSFARLNFIMANPGDAARILDTSVIIDGRIKDILSANFMAGNIVVPEFVLDELQRLADSADAKRRARGRRGLEMLEMIKDATPRLIIMDKDFPDVKDVDHKLIALAKEIGGDVVTNDFNLQKVAVLHRVNVLNINELANMLKPTAFVGETIYIVVSKEGKEIHQGIGYLEDGTMVVVEDGRARIGTEVEVTVTSILPTAAGRMIFARPTDYQPPDRARGDTQRPDGPAAVSPPSTSGAPRAARIESVRPGGEASRGPRDLSPGSSRGPAALDPPSSRRRDSGKFPTANVPESM